MISDSSAGSTSSGGPATHHPGEQQIPALLAGLGNHKAGRVPARQGCSAAGGAGFTIIELLVVVSLVVILAALTLPALQSSLAVSRRVQCASNLRQLAQAVRLFAADHGNRIPPEAAWMNYLAPYVGQPSSAPNLSSLGVFRCPAGWNAGAQYAATGNQATYWYNCHSYPFAESPGINPTSTNTYYFSSPPLSLFIHPDQTVILACWWFYVWNGNWTTPPSDTHAGCRPVAYLDGHVVLQTGTDYYVNGAPPMSALTVY
jgi:prepilin-type N-terminal cleavage/methylation domain-containing protein